MSSQTPTDYRLTFKAIQMMDDIRAENHCVKGLCAYHEGCVCWDELLSSIAEPSVASESATGTSPVSTKHDHA